LRRLQKTGSDCADVTWCGKLFQTREAATEKARKQDYSTCVTYHAEVGYRSLSRTYHTDENKNCKM